MFYNLREEIKNAFGEWYRKLLTKSEEYCNKTEEQKNVFIESLLERIHVQHLAVTKEQITSFGLERLKNPDPETLLKLEGGFSKKKGRHVKGDSNTAWFKQEFGEGEVFQIEIDAMQARRKPFTKHVLDTVDAHFDKSIHKKHVEDALRPAQEKIKEILEGQVNDFGDNWVNMPAEEDDDEDSSHS